MNPWAYQGWPLFPSHCRLWDQGFHCLSIDISDLCVFVVALSIFSAACFVSSWWPFSPDGMWSDRSICCLVCPEPEGWASTWLEPTRWWSLIQTGTPAMTFRHRTGKGETPAPPCQCLPPPPFLCWLCVWLCQLTHFHLAQGVVPIWIRTSLHVTEASNVRKWLTDYLNKKHMWRVTMKL